MRKQPMMRTEGNAHAAAKSVLYDESSVIVIRENATEAAMMRPIFYYQYFKYESCGLEYHRKSIGRQKDTPEAERRDF
jgi:hypothetical protein